jgi:hypothetical protein
LHTEAATEFMERSAETMLATACPSIRYRMQVEILGRSSCEQGMRELQQAIQQDPLVKRVMGWAQQDGWLAWDFHGQQSTETGIRVLCEKGVGRGQPVLAAALAALQRYPDRLERGIGRIGRILDDGGFGGSRMILAATLARAGLEEAKIVREQVRIALECLCAVERIHSLSELVEPYRQQPVFRPGVRWPGIYHLRLLAFTENWRTPENCALAARAVQRLVDLSPLPSIHVRHRSQLVAPASFAMQDFNPDLRRMDPAQWMMWFHRTECLARMGIVHLVPQLREQVQQLADMVEQGAGAFRKPLHHPYFTRWGAYTGLMLEPDWRAARRRINDLTFRSLLIMHFATLCKTTLPSSAGQAQHDS